MTSIDPVAGRAAGHPATRARTAAPARQQWYSTETAADYIGGVSARWVRRQIELGRLPARALLTGRRPTYRISASDLGAFVSRYVRATGGEPSS